MSPLARAWRGPPYSQGGRGKYGFESDQKLFDSAHLLMKMKGEHLGTGAGVGCGRRIKTCNTDTDISVATRDSAL